MTREEAINKWVMPAIKNTWNEKKCGEIIEALEQQPCEEMISKKAIIDKLQTNEASDYFGSVTCAEIIDFINDLPLISSKQETVSKESYDAEYFARKDAEFQLYKAERECCKDAISRQAVLDIVNNPLNIRLDEIIKKLPHVNPQPKTGHWIYQTSDDYLGELNRYYECSECGRTVGDTVGNIYIEYPYCHCGAKMIEPPESEG